METVRWAFTTVHEAYWIPLTWLSLALDCRLFGLNAGAHLLENTALHAANAVLLYAVLVTMTGAVGRSAWVAALFALHPLHVESVAWVSRAEGRAEHALLDADDRSPTCAMRAGRASRRYLVVTVPLRARPAREADAGHVAVHAPAARRLAARAAAPAGSAGSSPRSCRCFALSLAAQRRDAVDAARRGRRAGARDPRTRRPRRERRSSTTASISGSSSGRPGSPSSTRSHPVTRGSPRRRRCCWSCAAACARRPRPASQRGASPRCSSAGSGFS